MRDVAEHASVSPMTVSRVLHDDPGVSKATRARVLAAVDSLGYRRNEVARNLRLGRTSGLIGLVVTNLANPFYSQFALGVESGVSRQGLKVVLTNTDEDVERERRLVEELTARRVDGMIVVPAGNDHSHLAAQPGSVPIVLGARPPSGVPLDCVLVDDFGGAREATAGLLAAGHTRLGFLGLPPSVWTSSERFRGFCVALEEAGVALDERYVRLRQRTIPAAEAAARELLELPRPPTALFCANSRNTLGAFRATSRLGRPVSLAGFDDFELADVLGVPLIVAYDPRELGRRAAELLLRRMNESDADPDDAAPLRIVVPTKVVRYGDPGSGQH
ncbi:LacI family transcriptional regulator [Streptomyces sp. CNQ-509]|uniref:LacI family DNA-binding transcriptional regulator n=1 Tax=unclassified Streptomyces TaxID=2593676 RepID=UPI00062E00EC|nr:LacI family DNA-binding transcriptional regulator [Streptomyces sp. CNQ-509]AKH81039.1 LacI family transcriptional regulator [Streptomyces sp. CNQ-509]